MDDASRTHEMWAAPVVLRRIGGEATRTVLPAQAAANIDLPGCAPYIVNAGQSGFLRVHYDRANFAGLLAQFHSLDDADQLGILLDYWAFGRSGDAPFTDYLDLTTTLTADADPVIVMDTAGSMLAFDAYAQGRPSQASVRAYGRRALRPFFDRLGWQARPGEAANDGLARAQLIAALGALGDADIIAEAHRRVRAADADPGALPAGIRAAVLTVYASNANAADFEDMLARARAATDFVEQRRLWVRLAGARDPALAQRALQMTLGEEIPRQLRPQVIAEVSGEHPRMAWDFLVANRAAVEDLLDPLQRFEYATHIASQSPDPAVADELLEYSRDFPEGARPSVASAAATIRLRAQTVAERMPVVEAWIAARTAGATSGQH
jgi:aminopeptidase N